MNNAIPKNVETDFLEGERIPWISCSLEHPPPSLSVAFPRDLGSHAGFPRDLRSHVTFPRELGFHALAFPRDLSFHVAFSIAYTTFPKILDFMHRLCTGSVP